MKVGGRGIVVAAVVNAARHHQWRLLIAPRDEKNRLKSPRRWQSDAVLVSLRDRAMAEHLRR
jgi:hypothetical protein